MQAQLDAAIAQQVALGATIKQKKEDKEEFADLVLQLKKVKQQVNALSKQLNPVQPPRLVDLLLNVCATGRGQFPGIAT